jgi:hypothetical protein
VIQIGFSTSNAWYSRMIRWVTKSKCSHTFLICDFYGRRVVLEEGPFGYFPSRLFSAVPSDELVGVFTPRASQEALAKAVHDSIQDIGQAYGYLVLIGMAVVYLGRWLGKKWRNPLASGRSNICSERNCKILKDAEEPGVENMDPSATSPEDLLELYK